LTNFEKTQADLKKGVLSKEPDELKRLEDEDLIKMNLDDAICGLSEDEIEALSTSGNNISGDNKKSINLFYLEEEQKTQDVNFADIQDEIKQFRKRISHGMEITIMD
jgi:molybdopterin converting factor small subunit